MKNALRSTSNKFTAVRAGNPVCWSNPDIVDNALKLIVISRFKCSACRRSITDASALFSVEFYINNRRRIDFVKKSSSVGTT